VPSKELEDFNNIAMEEYRKRVVNYLKNTSAVTTNKAKIDSATGKSRFEEKIDEKWTEAIAIAKQKITKTLKSEKNGSK
jgi:hypothetical protein